MWTISVAFPIASMFTLFEQGLNVCLGPSLYHSTSVYLGIGYVMSIVGLDSHINGITIICSWRLETHICLALNAWSANAESLLANDGGSIITT